MRVVFFIFVCVAVLALAIIPLAGTFYCAAGQLPDQTCAAIEIAHLWQTWLSGILALAAAAVTVWHLRAQVAQAERHRKEDTTDRLSAIANTLGIELLDTSSQLHDDTADDDLMPLSETARHSLIDAAEINPALAAAIQAHCSEIERFRALHRRARSTEGLNRPPVPTSEMRRAMAYRAVVLSYCCVIAGQQMRETGKAEGPFIDHAQIEEFERQHHTSWKDRRYLNPMFAATGSPELNCYRSPTD